MPKVMNVEKKIRDVEEFDVIMRDGNGKDLRGDKKNLPQYSYFNRLKGEKTVSQWINSRFNKIYPGLKVSVLDGDGCEVPGQTKLSTLRASYVEEDED